MNINTINTFAELSKAVTTEEDDGMSWSYQWLCKFVGVIGGISCAVSGVSACGTLLGRRVGLADRARTSLDSSEAVLGDGGGIGGGGPGSCLLPGQCWGGVFAEGGGGGEGRRGDIGGGGGDTASDGGDSAERGGGEIGTRNVSHLRGCCQTCRWREGELRPNLEAVK